MKPVYYNDNDKFCAEWLRQLIAGGHLPAGDAINPILAAEFIRAAA